MISRTIFAAILLIVPLALTAPVHVHLRASDATAIAASSANGTSVSSANNASSTNSTSAAVNVNSTNVASAACTSARNDIVADLQTTTALVQSLSKHSQSNPQLVAAAQAGVDAANQGVARIAAALNSGGTPAADDRTDVLNGLSSAATALNSIIQEGEMAKVKGTKVSRSSKKLLKGAKKTAKDVAKVQTDAQNVIANCN